MDFSFHRNFGLVRPVEHTVEFLDHTTPFSLLSSFLQSPLSLYALSTTTTFAICTVIHAVLNTVLYASLHGDRRNVHFKLVCLSAGNTDATNFSLVSINNACAVIIQV